MFSVRSARRSVEDIVRVIACERQHPNLNSCMDSIIATMNRCRMR